MLEGYYDETQMAELLGLSRATLAKNRSLGKNHPPFIKLGKRPIYPKRDFELWLKSHTVHIELRGATRGRAAEKV